MEVVGPDDIVDRELDILFVSKSVKTLLQETCLGCYRLRYVIFETGTHIETIDHMALAETGIYSLDLPASIRNLGQAVFANCHSLNHLGLPEGLTELQADLCTGTLLSTITVPQTVREIGPGAFQECPALAELKLASNYALRVVGSEAFQGTQLNRRALPPDVTVADDAF